MIGIMKITKQKYIELEKEYNYRKDVLAKEISKQVGEAAKDTTETAVSPLVAFWRFLTGKGKPRKIVTDPIEKSGETVYDTAVNTGKTVVGEKK